MGYRFLKTKLRDSARGQECQIRIPGICNYDCTTTVLAHLNGAGWALKHSDMHGAYACSRCHAVVDGEKQNLWDVDTLKLWHLEGTIRTQVIMLGCGLIKI